MEPMPYKKQFEKHYREIDPEVNCHRFSIGETGFYKSEHTYKEYQWFSRGYRDALKSEKEI